MYKPPFSQFLFESIIAGIRAISSSILKKKFLNLQTHIRINYLEIWIIEAVYNVPAKLLEFLALEKHSVKEDQSEQEFLVFWFCVTSFELLLGYQSVEALHVGFQSFWRFRRHLYSGLQNRYGKLGSRARAQPQSICKRKYFLFGL